MTGPYKKRLEGVKPSKDLKELLSQSLNLCQETSAHPNKTDDPCQPLTSKQAQAILNDWKKENTVSKTKWIPIPVIRAMQALLDAQAQERLEVSLHQSALVFTPNQQAEKPTTEQEKFQKRLERLRLKQEETKYNKLTHNLHLGAPADDVTTRSMTYAASIGLNMIIAPLSFGCFMYFFAGGVMSLFWSRDELLVSNNAPDIKRIIIAVVSGVLMLFTEMILFVIRTHEMDKAVRKKSRKKQDGPFGHYTSNTQKSYTE